MALLLKISLNLIVFLFIGAQLCQCSQDQVSNQLRQDKDCDEYLEQDLHLWCEGRCDEISDPDYKKICLSQANADTTVPTTD